MSRQDGISDDQIRTAFRIAQSLSSSTSRRYPGNTSLASDELFSEALVTIADASKKFKAHRGATWETFVYRAIVSDFKNLLAKQRITVHRPASFSRYRISFPARQYRHKE